MTIKEMYRKSFWFQLLLTSVVGILIYNAFTYAEDAEDWMPDPNLRRVVSEKLGVENLTIADMQRLHDLVSDSDGIESLEGLQHAVNLKFLQISKSQVSDLTPLAELVKLNTLKIAHNPFSDLTPLARLVNLEWLQLNDCQISDLTPLAGLVNLRWLFLQYNQISDITPIKSLTQLERLEIIGNPIDYTHAVGASEDWMPDPNLEQAVREELGIPDEIPIHPGDMTGLHNLFLIEIEHGIRSLKGLEYAVNLKVLVVDTSEVSDLTPLAGLENLEALSVVRSEVSDLAPLAGLENLRVLKLYRNRILDIAPLAGLINLEVLSLQQNQIEDVTPLLKLINLQEIRIYGNRVDVTELLALNLPAFNSCDLPREPVEVRLGNRNMPATFLAAQNIINLPTLTWDERLTYHDLYLSVPDYFDIEWFLTADGWKLIGDIERAKSIRNALLSQNPDMIFIADIRYYHGQPNEYPEDWKYWLRDASGKRVEVGNWDVYWIDFTHPEIQDMFIQQAIEVARCGLYDGINLDHWSEGARLEVARTLEEEHTARDRILQGIRKAVRDDFLILVNTNGTQIPRWAPYVNGAFMETTRKDRYTDTDLHKIESALLWSEQNFREPGISALVGKGIESEPLDSPKNRQLMRLFTTMSLTHSDGYVLYTTGINSPVHTHAYELYAGHSEVHAIGKSHDHQNEHYWYRFYEAPLGQPIGGDETKGQLHENREGLFIREFTNGWAVYNRSGSEQQIEFAETVSGWSSGVEHQRRHTLADLDGEIYLKSETPPTADVNADGVVNIQDLVIVANAFGEAAPDMNGDGVVNIQDLVIVANAF